MNTIFEYIFFQICFFLLKKVLSIKYVRSFSHSRGLSDFHLMTLTVMRKSFKKYQPKTINYRSYKSLSNEKYRETLIENLSKENFINNDDGFRRFCHISLDVLTNMHHVRRSMFKVIKCPSLIKNCRKQ